MCTDDTGINDNVVLSQQQNRPRKCGRVCECLVGSNQRPFSAREGRQRFLSWQVRRSTSLPIAAEARGQSAAHWSYCLYLRLGRMWQFDS